MLMHRHRGFLLVPLLAALGFSVVSARDFTPQERQHWAFQPLRNVSPAPAPQSGKSHIDSLITQGLSEKGLSLNPRANAAALLRRASLDLLGLPPAPAETENFLADDSFEAFEKALDRMLQSPHYGERAARHWLDLARYAESEGFKADETRPNVWRYRDYVIKSFNEDKPYDRFLKEQLAGDEFWPDNPDALIATGFNRHYPDESNARNLMQRRQEILNDVTDTAGAVFTGLTFGCARCHDHKSDPILQADYYRLQAFFANTAANDNVPLLSRNELANYQARLKHWEEATRDIREKIEAIEAPHRQEIINDYVEKYPAEIRVALNKAAGERTPFECQMVAKAELYIRPDSHQFIGNSKAVAGRLKGEQKKEWEKLQSELKTFAHLHPGELPTATGMLDISAAAPMTYVLARGTYDTAGNPVKPGFLAILGQTEIEPIPVPAPNSTGRRAALAEYLARPDHPLTARVMVNRIWQTHFGRGLVETASDFGMKGSGVSHPELLDYLAGSFIKNGWSIKALHKEIMLSAVYQQSAAYHEQGGEVDPENKLLWRFPRQRLQGEVIRDAALAVSGLLNPAMGGPSIFPELPAGLQAYGGWKTSAELTERNRRSIYVFVKRNLRYPMFESFDMPDTHESCARRMNTTSPLQALTMLNGKVSLEWAQGFAGRLIKAAPESVDAQLRLAWQLAYNRTAAEEELTAAREFLRMQTAVVRERLDKGEAIAGPAGFDLEQSDRPAAAALVDLCHTLLNSNEFVYLN